MFILLLYLSGLFAAKPAPQKDSLVPYYPASSLMRTEERIEDQAEQDKTDDPEELLASLQQYRENPLNLNLASAEELRSLRLLDEWQISALIHYRESYGKIVCLQELSDHINGFSAQTIVELAPYVCLENSNPDRLPSPKKVLQQGKHRIMARYGRILQPNQAYLQNKYAGSPDNYYLRYTFDYKNRIRAGLAAQQDAGEPFTRQGFDFYSGYLVLSHFGPVRNLVVGTYRADWGFGLNVHSPGGFYNSVQPDLIMTTGQGIRPYASGAEYGYLRGAAADIQLPRSWRIGVFYSCRNRDGSLLAFPSIPETDADEDNSGSESVSSLNKSFAAAEQGDNTRTEDVFPGQKNPDGADNSDRTTIIHDKDAATGKNISPCKNHPAGRHLSADDFLDWIRSMPETGYHRTESEIAGKGRIREQISGLNVEKNLATARFGITVSAFSLGGTYTPERRTVIPNAPIVSDIRPHRGANFSAYYQWLLRQFHFYGEAAISHRGDPAFLQGIQWKAAETFSLSARYSHHSANYYAAYADRPNPRPIVSGTAGTQRQAVEWQTRILLPAGFSLELYGQETIERKNRNLPISYGSVGGALTFRKTPCTAYLRFRQNRSKTRNGHSLRANLAWSLPAGFFGESRFEMRNFTQGMLLLQDFGYATASGRFRCRFRIALFHTENYDARIYAYEHDVLYASYAPALYGKGVRFCILLKQSVGKGFSAELKYAHTLMDGVRFHGSGNNRIESFLKPEIKIQMHYKF